jgi:predicted ribonuclease YlaK
MRKRTRNTQMSAAKKKRPAFELRKVSPLTINQDMAFSAYDAGKNMVLHGYAGTGKTFVALYLGLREILSSNQKYDKLVVIRSAVPSRDMGYMPGTAKEKARVYEEPYKEICDNLFGREQGYDTLKSNKLVHFTTTSYLRGLTFQNALVIVDEIQNLSFGELDTIITRLGENSRIIFCGDFRQSDLKDNSGLFRFLNIINKVSNFEYIEFKEEDIVRSGTVKEYIIWKTRLQDANI